jgi:hypothetical protein
MPYLAMKKSPFKMVAGSDDVVGKGMLAPVARTRTIFRQPGRADARFVGTGSPACRFVTESRPRSADRGNGIFAPTRSADRARPTADGRSSFAPERSSGLEPPHQSRPNSHPMGLYSQKGPAKVRLQNYTVTVLVHCSVLFSGPFRILETCPAAPRHS